MYECGATVPTYCLVIISTQVKRRSIELPTKRQGIPLEWHNPGCHGSTSGALDNTTSGYSKSATFSAVHKTLQLASFLQDFLRRPMGSLAF